MCLVITKDQVNNPQIAENDLEVFKICTKWSEDIAISIFEDFPYRKGELYKTELTYVDPEYHGGFDSVEMRYLSKLERDGNAMMVLHGFHALNSLDKNRLGKLNCLEKDDWVCSFTIPAGSEYLENPTGCIVSNQIIFNDYIYQP